MDGILWYSGDGDLQTPNQWAVIAWGACFARPPPGTDSSGVINITEMDAIPQDDDHSTGVTAGNRNMYPSPGND